MKFILDNLLYKELKTFSKTNWWVYIIFILCLFLIWYTNKGNIYEVVLVFMFHFLWDLFIMMMGSYHARWDLKKSAFSQLWSYITFGVIWLYAWLTSWKWTYFIPQISFLLPNLRWFLKDIKGKTVNFLNWKLSLIVWIFVFLLYYALGLIWSLWEFIQILWFVIFPLSLMIDTKKVRYFLSLIGLFFITFGSGYEFTISFISWNVTWVDISYTLLPLTVFVFFLKDIKKFVWR